jgi:CheY-like chemotaxis protein
MDMQMPEMDGLEATRKLRKTYSLDELTIVGLTANSSSEDINACLQSGMNDHLSKPISIAKLSRCLSHWLR